MSVVDDLVMALGLERLSARQLEATVTELRAQLKEAHEKIAGTELQAMIDKKDTSA